MPPSFEQLFIQKVAAAAARCAADTGLWTSVVLAQWADETAWGTSRAWLLSNNPAGISPHGTIASYATEAVGFSEYIRTMNLSFYDGVRAAKLSGPLAQARALGASPWAAGHYAGAGETPGSSLVTIIESNDLTAYDGAEGSLNPKPQPQVEPTQKDDDVNPFIAQVAGEAGEFVIWPDGEKSFIADPADTAQFLEQWAQSAPRPITAGTLAQIPSKQLPTGAPPAPQP
jgi:hypothetical protein